MNCYTGTYEAVVAANNQINFNCGFPDAWGMTWDTPKKAYNYDFYFIAMPRDEGYKSGSKVLTQEQMIADIVDVEIRESQSNWWPPFNP